MQADDPKRVVRVSAPNDSETSVRQVRKVRRVQVRKVQNDRESLHTVQAVDDGAASSSKPVVRRRVRRVVVRGAQGETRGQAPVQADAEKRRPPEAELIPQVPDEAELENSQSFTTSYGSDADVALQQQHTITGWPLDDGWEEDLERWAAYSAQKAKQAEIQMPPRRRRRVFWKLYALLIVLILGMAGYAMVYTYDSLVRYEESQPQVFVEHLVEDLSKGGKPAQKRLGQVIDEDALSPYDSVALLNERFEAGVGKPTDAYRIEKGGKSFDVGSPIYNIYVDDKPYMSLHMQAGKSYTRLGLFTITDWSVSNSILYADTMPEDADELVDEGLTYTVAVQDSTTVEVNGHELDDKLLSEDASVIEGFEYAAQFVDPPEAVSYVVKGLRTVPEVSAQDFEGNEIELTQEGYSFLSSSLSEPNRTSDQLPVNVLDVAETWSLFMSDMLGGYNHGIDQVTAFLVPGSELYQQAEAFVSNIDITFVAGGVLAGFTEEEVSNCVMYNDRLFACDVHFIKNINLASTGAARPDEFDNRMIFAYIDSDDVAAPGWYLVNMQAITSDDAED